MQRVFLHLPITFRLLYCRYLWPLIHYHKFLAKCIKKLKRNGVDVKTSVSPVAVFLREEVCAVSDHLASVSLFTSEEWMDCLVHFNGWTDHSPVAEKRLRNLISKLSLRPLDEPGDVDSPLLRSQVDEHFQPQDAASWWTKQDPFAPTESYTNGTSSFFCGDTRRPTIWKGSSRNTATTLPLFWRTVVDRRMASVCVLRREWQRAVCSLWRQLSFALQ